MLRRTASKVTSVVGMSPTANKRISYQEEKFQAAMARNQEENGTMSGDVLAWLTREAVSRDAARLAAKKWLAAASSPAAPLSPEVADNTNGNVRYHPANKT